ncbi:MAG TPA: hypothetical protein VFA27_13065 [Vicinamibacterales bacterium]|nr:hypothetical protein [Vicinamibacterales bacterium]
MKRRDFVQEAIADRGHELCQNTPVFSERAPVRFLGPVRVRFHVLRQFDGFRLSELLARLERFVLALDRDALREIVIGRVRGSAMLAPMEPEAIPVRVHASAVAVARATLEQLHGSRSSTDVTVCSAMNRFNVSDDTRVRRPTLTYAIRRALSQLRSVPGRTPMYSAACSTDISGPGRGSLTVGVFMDHRTLQTGFPNAV